MSRATRKSSLAIRVAGLAALAVFAACGGGEDETVSVDFQAIESLQEYAFVSEIEVTPSEGDLDVTYDGVMDSTFRVQATFSGEGDLLDRFDMPPRAEIITVDGDSWIREPGGAWQAVGSADAPQSLAPLLLSLYATPTFYLTLYGFDDLELPVSGSDTIGGVEAANVRLEREDIVGLISNISTALTALDGGRAEVSEDDRADIEQDALEGLPEDFVVETWIAKDGGYPVRIGVTFTVPEGNEGLFVGEFPGGSKVNLQMDITDPDVVVDIEPPAVE